MAEEPKAKAAPASANPLDKAADRLRDSAKWLLASFSAVAVVIFAGLTVADLGQLDGDTPGYRLLIAVVAAVLAIAGIVGALARAMSLAGASTTSLADLTRQTTEAELREAKAEAAADPALTTWGGDFAAFVADYNHAYDEYVQQAEAYALDPAKRPDRSGLQKARFHLQAMSAISTRLLRTVSFLRLQRSFANARKAIVAWMIVTAVGAVMFGWATSGIPDDDPPELTDAPVMGVLRPGDDVVKELNRQLSGSCRVASGDAIPVIVLSEGTSGDTVRLVTVPGAGCPPARATAPLSQVTNA
jgi:hypothetical protein